MVKGHYSHASSILITWNMDYMVWHIMSVVWGAVCVHNIYIESTKGMHGLETTFLLLLL